MSTGIIWFCIASWTRRSIEATIVNILPGDKPSTPRRSVHAVHCSRYRAALTTSNPRQNVGFSQQQYPLQMSSDPVPLDSGHSAARQTVKDLFKFGGDPEDWPRFIATLLDVGATESTQVSGSCVLGGNYSAICERATATNEPPSGLAANGTKRHILCSR